MGGIERLGGGLGIEPLPPLSLGLGGTVTLTVTVTVTVTVPSLLAPAAAHRQKSLMQFLGGGIGPFWIFARIAARERNQFDLVAAGRAFEAIESAGLVAPAIVGH